MADRDWRDLERRYLAGDVAVLPRLNVARRRVGLPIIRAQIVHYLKAEEHHRLKPDGEIDPRVSRWPVYGTCGQVQLWPRANLRKKVYYTHQREQVTCKTCLRCLASPKFFEGVPKLHLLLKHEDGRQHHICGGRYGGATEIVEQVGCEGCLERLRGQPRNNRGHELNARGRRRLRRRRQFAFKYPPPTGSQSDPWRHGIC